MPQSMALGPWAQPLGLWGSGAQAESCGPQASLLHGVRGLPGSGTEPVPSTLAGGFFTPESPGRVPSVQELKHKDQRQTADLGRGGCPRGEAGGQRSGGLGNRSCLGPCLQLSNCKATACLYEGNINTVLLFCYRLLTLDVWGTLQFLYFPLKGNECESCSVMLTL